MKNIVYTLLIITGLFFSGSGYAMKHTVLSTNTNTENQIHTIQLLPKEISVHIIGYCQPTQKNTLMKVCKDFYAWLQDRILIVQANPSTVSFYDKIKGMFCDSRNLLIWTQSLNPYDIKINRKNILGMTPFHVASNDDAAMRWLTENGKNQNELKPEIFPLHEAVYKGDTESVQALLTTVLGIDPNLALANKATPLIIAANGGYTDIVLLLINAGADVNKANHIGYAPLYVASSSGHTKVVQLLLGVNGIDVKQENNWGLTPLRVASSSGHTEVVQLLLQAGADVNQASKDGRTPLLAASANNHAKVVQLLLTADKIKINQADKDGDTPLCDASCNGHNEIVQLLLAADGIDVNQVNNDKCTPLYFASKYDHIKVVQLLLQAGANVNQTGNYEWMPLHFASRYGHTEVVQSLLNAGAYINQATNEGWAPLIMALDKGHIDIVRLLLDMKALVNQVTNDGWTPLSHASYKGDTEMVALLLHADANIHHALTVDSIIDPLIKAGDTALQIAHKKGHTQIVELIEEYLRREETNSRHIV
jgi:ankyrin repeat protein